MGSIRRSVERLRSRASRRSASVPENLNMLNNSEDYGIARGEKSVDEMGLSAGTSGTPQIITKSQGSDTSVGFSSRKRYGKLVAQLFCDECV